MILNIFIGLCNHQHTVSFEYFHNSRKKPWTPRNCTTFPSLQPLQQQIYSLSLDICPFWMFPDDQVIQYMVFGDQLFHSANILKFPLCGSVAVYSNGPSKAGMASRQHSPSRCGHIWS